VPGMGLDGATRVVLNVIMLLLFDLGLALQIA
jgi:hypothetical protein